MVLGISNEVLPGSCPPGSIFGYIPPAQCPPFPPSLAVSLIVLKIKNKHRHSSTWRLSGKSGSQDKRSAPTTEPLTPMLPSLHPQGGPRSGTQAIPVPPSSVCLPSGVKGRKNLGQVTAALSVRWLFPPCSLPWGVDTHPQLSFVFSRRGGWLLDLGKRGAEEVVSLLTLVLHIHEEIFANGSTGQANVREVLPAPEQAEK